MADWTRTTAVTALVQLRGVGPVRLDQLLQAGDPVDLVGALCAGSPSPPRLGRVDEAESGLRSWQRSKPAPWRPGLPIARSP